MKLHEYQSKLIFAKYGIPIPKGQVAATSHEAKAIAEELGGRVVIKAQVLIGGHGKAGGVRLAKEPNEAEQLATQILGMQVRTFRCAKCSLMKPHPSRQRFIFQSPMTEPPENQ